MATMSAVSLAGCSGNGDSGNGGNGNGNGGSGNGGSGNGNGGNGNGDVGGGDSTTVGGDGMGGTEARVAGELLESSVPGLTVIDHEANPSMSNFGVRLTVENTGTQRVDLIRYSYDLSLYDAGGTDIKSRKETILAGADEIPPGETGTISIQFRFRASDENTPDDVERYEISMSCGRGTYCREETADATTTEGTGPADGPASKLPTYTFSEGESYTYGFDFGDYTGEETWTVTSVDGNEVTVEVVTRADGTTETTTVSGTNETIYARINEELSGSFFGLLRVVPAFAQYGELTAGNTFTVEAPSDSDTWATRTVEVEGETTVNGVTCTEFTATVVDSETDKNVIDVIEACVADGYPFALSLSLESGNNPGELTLIEATRP